MKKTLLLTLTVIALCGCTKQGSVSRTFVATAGTYTKTVLSDDLKVSWSKDDRILYYSSPNGAVGTYYVPCDCRSTTFQANTGSDDQYLIAVSGAAGIEKNGSTSFVINDAVRSEQSGSFADAHIAVAKASFREGITEYPLEFVCVTSIVKFSLERTDVSYVVFSASDGTEIQGGGTVKINLYDSVPSAFFPVAGGSDIRVNTGGNGTFYLGTIACSLGGYSLKCYSSDGKLIGTVTDASRLELQRGKVVDLGKIDDRIDTTDPDIKAFRGASWNWTSESGGVVRGYAHFIFRGQIQSISVVRYPESSLTSSIVYEYGDKCTTADVVAVNSNAAVALNGSFFNTKTWVSTMTLIIDGKLLATSSKSELSNRSNGVVAFDSKGVISIMPYDESAIEGWKNAYKYLLASGPLLIYDGARRSLENVDFNTARHPRTMIGVTADRTIVYTVVDGRFTGKAAGATMDDMAKIAECLDLKYALNLDGGGSSTIWTKGFGVMNYPCDNSTWDHAGLRKIPTVIIAK